MDFLVETRRMVSAHRTIPPSSSASPRDGGSFQAARRKTTGLFALLTTLTSGSPGIRFQMFSPLLVQSDLRSVKERQLSRAVLPHCVGLARRSCLLVISDKCPFADTPDAAEPGDERTL